MEISVRELRTILNRVVTRREYSSFPLVWTPNFLIAQTPNPVHRWCMTPLFRRTGGSLVGSGVGRFRSSVWLFVVWFQMKTWRQTASVWSPVGPWSTSWMYPLRSVCVDHGPHHRRRMTRMVIPIQSQLGKSSSHSLSMVETLISVSLRQSVSYWVFQSDSQSLSVLVSQLSISVRQSVS